MGAGHRFRRRARVGAPRSSPVMTAVSLIVRIANLPPSVRKHLRRSRDFYGKWSRPRKRKRRMMPVGARNADLRVESLPERFVRLAQRRQADLRGSAGLVGCDGQASWPVTRSVGANDNLNVLIQRVQQMEQPSN